MIDITKKYRTRDGREVRIYAVDGKGHSPIHGAVRDDEGWASRLWCADGGAWVGSQSIFDLIEVKPRIQLDIWVNVYRGREADWVTVHDERDEADDEGREMDWVTVHDERDEADDERRGQRIACVKLTIDCEEGEGL